MTAKKLGIFIVLLVLILGLASCDIFSGLGDLFGEEKDCSECDGSGNCNTCGGDGEVNTSLYYGYYSPCFDCNGSGECRECNGSGKED
jgi:hypothetical protein